MNDYYGPERRKEGNDFHRQQHNEISQFVGRVTQAVETMQKGMDKNWEGHDAMNKTMSTAFTELRTAMAVSKVKWTVLIGVLTAVPAIIVALVALSKLSAWYGP